MNILGICLPAILPNRGKQRAPVEKAACPCWASTVPLLGKHRAHFWYKSNHRVLV